MVRLGVLPVTEAALWVAQQIARQRDLRDWTQAELARRIGRTQTAVSYWEAGKRTPGLDDLLDLCEAFEVPLDSFLPPEHARQPVAAVLRATAERLASAELSEAIETLLAEAETAKMPERELEIGPRNPAYAANELLEKAHVADKAPVDVHSLARRCGVLVLKRPFPDSLSGLIFAHNEGAVIGVNSDHPDTRRRFSVAHELGHYLLDHHELAPDESRLHIDISEGGTPSFNWRAERAANEFAADLLMPRRLLSREFEHHPKPAVLAGRFEVSELAMGYRLVNLGLR
jgi:Zn-dependent peptidase ImmA (M78 family)/DNA-binding XRE family transcriptional regulator